MTKWFDQIRELFSGIYQFHFHPRTRVETLGDYGALQSLLPYESYDEATKLFYTENSVGMVFEASPLVGATEETVSILSGFVRDVLPESVDLQCIMWASPNINHVLTAFKQFRSRRNKTYAWLAQQRCQYLGKGTSESLIETGTYKLRDFKLLLVLSVKQQTHAAESLTQLSRDFQSTAKSAGLHMSPIAINAFLKLIREWLLVEPNYLNLPWQKHEPIKHQLSFGEQTLHVGPSAIRLSNCHQETSLTSLQVKSYAEHATIWSVDENLGQLFNTALHIPGPFLISLHVRKLNQSQAAGQAQVKFLRKQKALNSKVSTYNPFLEKEYQDWRYVRDKLAQGDVLVHTFHQVVLYSPVSKAGEVERKARDLFQANGWTLGKNKYLQLQSWLACLPMMLTDGLYEDLKRFARLKRMTGFNAMNVAPLVSDWKGGKIPALMLPSRRGQVCTWSPFDSEGNYNVAIAAASGKGKSTLTQEYIVSQLGSGGRVWVIDVGRSYEKTCAFLSGEFVAFNPASNICINPFSNISNFEDELSLLKPLIALMARPNVSTSDEENTFIEKALKQAWQLKAQRCTVTTVAQVLENMAHPIAKNLAHLLYPFTQNGMYATYFEGECTLQLNNEFIVLELEELKSKKDLQAIILFVLMYHITQSMFLGDRTIQKSCIIDEAWELLASKNDASARFIETGYRRARRYNANFITITQSINDYFKNSSSQAAYENSDWHLILGQNPEAILQLKNSKRLVLDAYLEKLLLSLRKTDEYAECLIKGANGASMHRIILDPYSRILFSSKGDEFEAVKRYQASGLDLTQAITRVAKEKFGGKIE